MQSAVEDELSKSGKFNLVERGRLKQVLEEVSFQQSGVTNDESAAKLGQQLNVDKLVFLRVHRLRQKYQLSLKVVDVSTNRILRAFEKSLGKKADAVGAPGAVRGTQVDPGRIAADKYRNGSHTRGAFRDRRHQGT